MLFNFEGSGRDSNRPVNPQKACFLRHASGGVAQLGEHLPCKQGVSGSIPLVSTNFLNLENHIEETNSLL